MSTMAVANTSPMGVDIERVLIGGDLARLTPDQRVVYYNRVCESIGLNPMTRPFDYLSLNGKLVLYARKDCADQLRALKGVSIPKLEREEVEGLYIVTAHAVLPNGRQDADTGAVNIATLKGEARANAIMKATTKAKRRVTLSICGLGFLDDTEVETIPGAYRVVVDEAGAVKGPAEGTREAQQAIVDAALAKEPDATVEGIADRRAAQEAEALAALEPHTVKHPLRENAPTAPAKGKKATLPPNVSFNMLESFAAIKKEIAEVTGEKVSANTPRLYYETLKLYGFAKSSEIPDRPKAVEVYKGMGKALTLRKEYNENYAELKELSSKAAFIGGETELRFHDAIANAGYKLQADIPPDQLPALLVTIREIVK